MILATDPEQVKNARMINTIFPKTQPRYRVTTNSEFRQTVDQFFGIDGDNGSVGDLLSGMEENDEEGAEVSEADVSAAAENELVKLVNKIIVDACRQGASDVHIEPRPGKEKTMIRFRKDGSLESYIGIPAKSAISIDRVARFNRHAARRLREVLARFFIGFRIQDSA